jgi:hypothetical protein
VPVLPARAVDKNRFVDSSSPPTPTDTYDDVVTAALAGPHLMLTPVR